MEKGAEAFRSIGEVASLIGVAPHVLRYWETQFSLLKPVKRGDGRRYYRPDDVRLIAGLCEVLRDEGLTIRGARKMLARDRGAAIRARGAARLGETMPAATVPVPVTETAIPVAAPEPVVPAPTAPLRADPPQPEPAPILAPLAHAPDGGEDTPHAPRARHRRRAVPAATLPLFPDLEPAEVIEGGEPATDDDWLTALTALAALLRATPAPLPPPAQDCARRLHDLLSARG